MNKRLGVQIGASGLAIVLGAFGIAQSRRDSQAPSEPEWEVEAPPVTGPPAPIAAVPTPFANSDSSWEDESGPSMVRQVVYEDGFALPPPQSFPDNQNFPDSPGVPGPAFADHAPPSNQFAQPSEAMSDPSAGPAGFALPGWSEPSASEAQVASNAPQLGLPQPASGPSLGSFGNAAPMAAPGPNGSLPIEANDFDDEDSPAPAYSFASPPVNQLREPATSDFNSVANSPPNHGMGGFMPIDSSQPLDDLDNDEDAEVAFDSPATRVPTFGVSEYADPQGAGWDDEEDDLSPEPSVLNQFAVAPTPLEGMASDAEVAPLPASPMTGPRLEALPENPGSLRQVPGGNAFASNAEFDQPEATRGAPQGSEPQLVSPPRGELGSATPRSHVASADGPSRIDDLLNEPGDRRLEGVQAPSIVIHKRAPDQVMVGKPATFVIQIQNVGVVEAAAVQIHDRIPAGMKLIDSTPQARLEGDRLTWHLGTLEAGGERTVSIQLVPETEGELGSVAKVTFEAAASVRTISTRPALKIAQRAPAQVLIGQQIEIELEVSNPGTGAAGGVLMQTDVPDGLEHPKGRQLDNLIGTLGPGEVRRQVLRLRAVAPGTIENEIRVTGEDGLVAMDKTLIEVIAPELALDLQGPSRRFLERQATYQIELANVGSAEATNVEIVAYLDRGFSFVGTEYQGQYDPNRHAVYWSLAELPPDARGAVPLTLLPIEQGERAIRLEVRGDLNLISRHEKRVLVDAPAELTFSITDDADPIEVGSMATYEIRILNRGAREDAEVKLQLQLPDGLELVSSEGDASTDGRGLVVFAPQASLPARGEIIHRVRVKGVKPGTHISRATVSSRQAPIAVTKEESTTVYADE